MKLYIYTKKKETHVGVVRSKTENKIEDVQG